MEALPQDADKFVIDPADRYHFDFRLLTPLFGGGAEPRKPDPVTPVRASEIRGHLRYWWRFLNSGPEMARNEAEVWGDTHSASRVSVHVETTSVKRAPCGKWTTSAAGKDRFEFDLGPDYFLFSFRPDKRADDIPSASVELTFRLFVRADKRCAGEVARALQLWANFGGLGSRRRRGCGALFCEKLALPKLVPFPKLRVFVGPEAADSMSAWKSLANVYQTFRQQGAGRVGQGRSHWPEADSLRGLTNVGDPAHRKSLTLRDAEQSPNFPRAEFGLPVIFHFRGEKTARWDESDESLSGSLTPVLDGQLRDRMGSPLILRPVKLQGGAVIPAIIRLPAVYPDSLHYKFDNKSNAGSPLQPLDLEFQRLDPPLFRADAAVSSHILGHKSILDAFLARAVKAPFYFREIASRS